MTTPFHTKPVKTELENRTSATYLYIFMSDQRQRAGSAAPASISQADGPPSSESHGTIIRQLTVPPANHHIPTKTPSPGFSAQLTSRSRRRNPAQVFINVQQLETIVLQSVLKQSLLRPALSHQWYSPTIRHPLNRTLPGPGGCIVQPPHFSEATPTTHSRIMIGCQTLMPTCDWWKNNFPSRTLIVDNCRPNASCRWLTCLRTPADPPDATAAGRGCRTSNQSLFYFIEL